MVNRLDSVMSTQWDAEQEKLVEALSVLANSQAGKKVRILNANEYKIASDDRSGFWRYWSGDGWYPTLNLVCLIFEKSLSHTNQALEISKISSDPKITDKMKGVVEAFKRLLPSSLSYFKELRDLYAGPQERDGKAAAEFTQKIDVYSLAILSVIQVNIKADLPVMNSSLNERSVSESPSAFLQQMASIQLKKIVRDPQLTLAESDLKESNSKTILSKVSRLGFAISVDQLCAKRLKHVEPIVSSLKKESELKKKLEVAHPDNHLVMPSRMDKARYTKPSKSVSKAPLISFTDKKQLSDAKSAMPTADDVLQSLWVNVSSKYLVKVEEEDKNSEKDSDSDPEWLII